jgi:SOS response regulatory protein OraA/RecX
MPNALSAVEILQQLEERLRSGEVLRRVLDRLPSGATWDDARFAHRRAKQEFRTPCSFLDSSLEIDRRRDPEAPGA